MRVRRVALGAASILLAATALWRTWPGLSPHSLSLDDLWVATLVKDGTLREVFALHPPVPLGFVAILDGVARLLGVGDWQLQAVAWVAYPLTIVGLVWLAAAVTDRAAAGVAAGALLSLSGDVAGLAIRVKQYTLDMALTVALLGAAVAARRSWARWTMLAGLSLVALIVSFPSAFVGPLLANLLLIDRWASDRFQWRRILGAGAAYNAAVAVIAFGVVHRQVTTPLISYWDGRFIPLHGMHDIARFLYPGSAWQFLSAPFPRQLGWLTLMIPLGIAAFLASTKTRVLGAFVVLFYVEMLVANALRLWPLGEMRLDTFAQPITILTAAAGVAWPFRWVKLVPEIAAAALLAFVVRAELHDRARYLRVGDKPVVQFAASQIRDSDSVVIFPWANWAVAYYGPWPARLVPELASTNQYNAVPERPNTLVLPEGWHGMLFNQHIEAVEGPLLPFLAQAKGRVVYLGTHVGRGDQNRIIDVIRRAGYHVVTERAEANALMVVLDRS